MYLFLFLIVIFFDLNNKLKKKQNKSLPNVQGFVNFLYIKA